MRYSYLFHKFLLLLVFFLGDQEMKCQSDYSHLHDIYAGSIYVSDSSISNIRLEINTTTMMMYGAIGETEVSSKIKLKGDKICFKKIELFDKDEVASPYAKKYISILKKVKYYNREKLLLYFFDRRHQSLMKLRKVD